MIVQIREGNVHKVARLLRLEPRVSHHTLIQMRSVWSEALAHPQVAHGVGDDVALHNHDRVLGHGSEVSLAVVSVAVVSEVVAGL